jgi:hypothetical protein
VQGGLATLLHADYVASRIKAVNASIRVVAMPDAGFFMDHLSVVSRRRRKPAGAMPCGRELHSLPPSLPAVWPAQLYSCVPIRFCDAKRDRSWQCERRMPRRLRAFRPVEVLYGAVRFAARHHAPFHDPGEVASVACVCGLMSV